MTIKRKTPSEKLWDRAKEVTEQLKSSPDGAWLFTSNPGAIYSNGWHDGHKAAQRYAKARQSESVKQLARIRKWATTGKSAVLLPEEFDQIINGEWK